MLRAAGRDIGGERDQLGSKVLGLDRAGAAVAVCLELRLRGMIGEEAEQEAQRGDAANGHSLIVGWRRTESVTEIFPG